MPVEIEDSWKQALQAEFAKPYFATLWSTIQDLYTQHTVYPSRQNIFNAFNNCPLTSVRVVILGQDPYHGPGQAHGLSFSVPDGVPTPPSLRNIYKEITNDIGTPTSITGNLTHWTNQGVLLLNTTLTVQAHKAGSHQKLGWGAFTDTVIRTISQEREHVVFLLWGNYARSKKTLIDTQKHHVLEAPHPSPLSAHRGFLGCKHFSQTNAYLVSHGQPPIKW